MTDSITTRLQTYHDLLLKWQKSVNLVAPSTLGEAWHRHFEDSLQLADFIGVGVRRVADMGSGAGFPGLVLAMARPDIHVHLIESDSKKATFLRIVSRETGTVNLTVHNGRIESVLPSLSVEIVTARALASLSALLTLAESQWGREAAPAGLVLLKGGDSASEIDSAQEMFDFSCDSHPSKTAPEARILCITGVSRRRTA